MNKNYTNLINLSTRRKSKLIKKKENETKSAPINSVEKKLNKQKNLR